MTSGQMVSGYEYTGPAGEVTVFLSLVEARQKQRDLGGGTIRSVTRTN